MAELWLFDSPVILDIGSSPHERLHPRPNNGFTVWEEQESPPRLEVCSTFCFIVVLLVQILFLGASNPLMICNIYDRIT